MVSYQLSAKEDYHCSAQALVSATGTRRDSLCYQSMRMAALELDKEMLDKVAQIGRQAALAAGAVLRQNYYKPHQITMKGAIDPVTESDSNPRS